jgi:hypothetical protein
MKLVAPMMLLALFNDINLTIIQVQSGMWREVYKTIDRRRKIWTNEGKRRAKVIS